MRRKIQLPKDGDKRTSKIFCLFPRIIPTDDGHEVRWLEFIWIEEKYTSGFSHTGHDYTPAGWYFSKIIK